MKHLFRLIIICFLTPLISIGQEHPCPPNEITTDPNNPVNDLHPLYENHHFDWTEERYDFMLGQNSPVNQISNPYLANQAGVLDLFNSNDYQPEDGWELVYVDLGLGKDGNYNFQASGQLWFMLYNKYRSIIRVFIATDQLSENNLVKIEIGMSGDYSTALLSSIDKVQKPLKHFDATNITSNTQKYTNSNSVKHWHYADFPVNYDPCTCEAPLDPNFTSDLAINVELIQQANIELQGTSQGTIQNMVSKTGPNDPSSSSWDDFYGSVKTISGSVEAGRKGFKSFKLFKSVTKESAEKKSKKIEMQSGVDNLGNFLSENVPGLQFVPYVSEALAIIDFFIGKQESAGTKIAPMSMELEHSFNGSLTAASPYLTTAIYVPGSHFTPTGSAPNGDARYPVYNEALGVYNLIEKPEITMTSGYLSRTWDNFYSDPPNNTQPVLFYPAEVRRKQRRALVLDPNSVKLVVNPASGLTLSEAYAQLVYTNEGGSFFIESSNTEGTIVNKNTWVSPLVPLSCAGSRVFFLDFFQSRKVGFKMEAWPALNESVKTALTLVFTNQQGERFLYKGTWQTKVNNVAYPHEHDSETEYKIPFGEYQGRVVYRYRTWDDWVTKTPFNNFNTGFYKANDNETFSNTTIDTDQIAKQTVTVENSLIKSSTPIVNDGITKILAGESIEVLPSSEIEPNSLLTINRLGIDCNLEFSIANASEISLACSSSEYQALSAKSSNSYFNGSSSNESKQVLNIACFPNPASEFINISLSENPINSEIYVRLKDLSGRIVLNKKLANKNGDFFRLNLSGLTIGTYLLEVEANSKVSVEKVFIN